MENIFQIRLFPVPFLFAACSSDLLASDSLIIVFLGFKDYS